MNKTVYNVSKEKLEKKVLKSIRRENFKKIVSAFSTYGVQIEPEVPEFEPLEDLTFGVLNSL